MGQVFIYFLLISRAQYVIGLSGFRLLAENTHTKKYEFIWNLCLNIAVGIIYKIPALGLNLYL